ncbi:MAG: PKD domain-containing protein [Thermoplasmata archaeon]|nr:PKD domain-containing protein [Thermoplasmata archaeon]
MWDDDAATFTVTNVNDPPVFGTPSPGNGSTGNLLSFTWSIPINDPDGNLFSWTIQCNNGQTNSGTSAANGTKSLSLSGLAYSTTYKVWVNATDPPTGSGLYTRRWYTFTTKQFNSPPVYGTPSPVNGSTGNLLSLTWGIPITDPEGNTFTWSIQCSNGQTNSGTGATNGTKTLALSGLAYSTLYKVWVNATDPTGSNSYTRRWYMFTTKANLPPVFGTPSPANGSTGNLLSLTWSIPINDPESNLFSWTIQCSNGQTTSGAGASNGTKSLALSDLAYLTTYKVWVNATDPTGSGLYTRRWYTFTTQQQQNVPPNKPNTSSGPASGKINTEYTYTTSTTDPNGDQVFYLWDWGDGTQSSWLGPYNSGQSIQANHTWTERRAYDIKVKAKDTNNAESNWSEPFTVYILQKGFFFGSIRNVNQSGDLFTFECKRVRGLWFSPSSVTLQKTGLMIVSKDSFHGFVGNSVILGRFYAVDIVDVVDSPIEITVHDGGPTKIASEPQGNPYSPNSSELYGG